MGILAQPDPDREIFIVSHPFDSAKSDATPPVKRPRFSWGVRLVLFVVLFDMIFHSMAVLYPWRDWVDELKIDRNPRGLPCHADIVQMRHETGDNSKVIEEFRQCAASLPRYWNPVPNDETRALLTSDRAWLKYGVTWAVTRMAWCEAILSIDQDWAMFSPNVGRRRFPCRARLFYADGSEVTFRPNIDKPDYTYYWRPGEGKNIGPESRVGSDANWEGNYGYCNYLSHRFAHNGAGSPLKEIRLYQVTVYFPPPRQDATAWLRGQMELTRDHKSPQAWPTFFIYDPETRQGRSGEFPDP